MNLLEALNDLGVDVSDGLDRVMGDTSLYEMMLGMFVDAVRDNPIAPEDFDGNDLDDLIKRIHTLKGVTGNLSLTPLFKGYNQALVLLREGSAAPAKAEFERILPTQAKVIDCIKQHQGA
ncbi:MAG: Hpt domain-containing protein [Clostridiales bacterium]|nr:Hpt domain-containing protein [Clostridiales bacterium]